MIPDVKEAAAEMIFDLDIMVPLLEQIRKFYGKQDFHSRSAKGFGGSPLSDSTKVLDKGSRWP